MTRWDLFRRMQEVGMRVYINTDAIGQGLNGLPKLMQRMVEENKATAMETLQLSTLAPAQALGLEERWGRWRWASWRIWCSWARIPWWICPA